MKNYYFLLAGLMLSIFSLSAQDKFDRFIGQMNRAEEACRRVVNTGNDLKRLSPVKTYSRGTTEVRVVGRKVKKLLSAIWLSSTVKIV